jgi:hypothetical protein
MGGDRTFEYALPYGVSYNMQAQYVMKVQAIRSKKQPPRFYVNIPLPLAAALDLEAGEQVQWQLLQRTDLRLRRMEAKKPRRGGKT